jgi:hypothetical protein
MIFAEIMRLFHIIFIYCVMVFIDNGLHLNILFDKTTDLEFDIDHS